MKGWVRRWVSTKQECRTREAGGRKGTFAEPPFLSSHSECNGPTQWKVIKIRCPWWSEECLCSGINSRQKSDSHWVTLPSLHFCCFYPSDKHADRRVVESALSAQLTIIHLPLLMVNHRSFACLTYSLLLTYCKLFPNFKTSSLPPPLTSGFHNSGTHARPTLKTNIILNSPNDVA